MVLTSSLLGNCTHNRSSDRDELWECLTVLYPTVPIIEILIQMKKFVVGDCLASAFFFCRKSSFFFHLHFLSESNGHTRVVFYSLRPLGILDL